MTVNNIKDQEIFDRAQEYAIKNGKALAQEITDKFLPEKKPVSIFMAGSPGAGKTEASIRLLNNTDNILRIDADELRYQFKDYQGNNSHLFQKAVSKLVSRIHDAALKKDISFLLDGTFANERIAKENINRSLKKGRSVFILFIYQAPLQAWDFVQEREMVEGRRILPDFFAEKFCASQKVVNAIKAEHGSEITLSLICKNINGTDRFFEKNIERIDAYISEKYTEQQILDEIRNQRD